MNKTWRNVLAISAAIIIPLGMYAYISLKLLTQITFKVFRFKVKSIGAGFIDLIITLEVKNPANVSVDIEGYNMEVKINDVSVAVIKNNEEKELKPHATSLLNIPITIKYLEFVSKSKFNLLMEYFVTGKTDKIFVNLDGNILGSVAKVPISTSIKVGMSVKEIMNKTEPKVEVGPVKIGR